MNASPRLGPGRRGENAISRVQVALGASGFDMRAQVDVGNTMKSPSAAMFEKYSISGPVFVRVTDCAGLRAPTRSSGKVKEDGESVTVGFPAVAMPLSATVRRASPGDWETARVPERVPVADGRNV